MGALLPRTTLKDDLRVYRRRIRIKININPVCPHSREIQRKSRETFTTTQRRRLERVAA